MARTIKVRRVNNAPKAIGQHLTLTNVRNTPGQSFAFGITDDGDEVYISGQIVKAQQMTEADIGAGLTCPLRNNPRANEKSNNPPYVAINPVKWDDDDPEEIIVDGDEEPDIQAVDSEDWDEVVKMLADLTEMRSVALRALTEIGKVDAVVAGLKMSLTDISNEMLNASERLDELAPEVNE